MLCPIGDFECPYWSPKVDPNTGEIIADLCTLENAEEECDAFYD